MAGPPTIYFCEHCGELVEKTNLYWAHKSSHGQSCNGKRILNPTAGMMIDTHIKILAPVPEPGWAYEEAHAQLAIAYADLVQAVQEWFLDRQYPISTIERMEAHCGSLDDASPGPVAAGVSPSTVAWTKRII